MVTIQFKVPNKLLSITENKKTNTFYFGDFLGCLYSLNFLDLNLKMLYTIKEPISCIDILAKDLILGTWNGNIYKNNELKLRLGNQIIKAIKTTGKYVIISQDTSIYVLDSKFNVLHKIHTEYKTICFCEYNDVIYCGMNIPFLGKLKIFENENDPFTSFTFEILETTHETSILGITVLEKQLVTCSADKTIKKGSETIYSGMEWIRCIKEDAYADGNNFYIGTNKIYTHSDNISGIGKIDNNYVSIGLDGVICLSINDIKMTDKEAAEIELSLRNCL